MLTDAEMGNIGSACIAGIQKKRFQWESVHLKRMRVTTLDDGRVRIRLLRRTPELLTAVVHYCRDNHARQKLVTIDDFVITFDPRPITF